MPRHIYKQTTNYGRAPSEEKVRRIRWLTDMWDRYDEYWRPEVERAVRNARMYWAVNFGQWPAYVVEQLRNQGRRPPTYPIIPDKIETLVGSFLANDFDVKIEPADGTLSSIALKVQDMYLADRQLMDWETTEIMALLDAHIMMSCERMVVSDAQDEFGNIAWEHLDPTHVRLHPGWKSNYNKDLKDYFTYSMMTPEEIMQHPAFKTVSEKLRDLYEREKTESVDYGVYPGAVPLYKSLEEKWNNQHKVYEYHYTVDTTGDYEYDLKNHAWFPDTGFPMSSEEDIAVKREYVQLAGLTPDDVTYLPRKRREKRIETICPTIDRELFLQSGKDIVQTNNVNLYCGGIRFRGQFQGIVDRLYDIQINYNKGKMNIADIQSRAAKGAFILDRMLSGGDTELERQIEEAWNDPAARIWVDEGATERLAKGGVVPLPSTTPTSDMFAEPQDMLQMADRFSKVPAAQDSRTESSKESGVLFRHKLEMGMIGQKFLMKGYERLKKEKAEAWIAQAKITYAGMPRQFSRPGGKEVFWVNQPAQEVASGRPVVIDDISLMPRMRVTLIPSKSGINIRTQLRSEYAEMLETTGKNPQLSLLHVTYMGLIMETQDVPEEGKDQLKHAVALIQRHEATRMALEIAQMEGKLKMMVQSGAGQSQIPPDEEENAPPQISPGQQSGQMAAAGTPQQQIQ